jgi:hypothetical protein
MSSALKTRLEACFWRIVNAHPGLTDPDVPRLATVLPPLRGQEEFFSSDVG